MARKYSEGADFSSGMARGHLSPLKSAWFQIAQVTGLANEGSLITIRLVARPSLWLSCSHLLCLFTCKSVVNKYYFDAVLSISA